jgi:YtcA family
MRKGRDMTGRRKVPIRSLIRSLTIRSTIGSITRRAAPAGVLSTALPLLAGCSRAPTFNILGSFFPSWILCGVIGILLTVAARVVFVRMNFEQELSPLILVYPCLAGFFTFTVWLLFFS